MHTQLLDIFNIRAALFRRCDLKFYKQHEQDVIIASTNKLHNYEHMATEVLSVKRNTTFTWNNDNFIF